MVEYFRDRTASCIASNAPISDIPGKAVSSSDEISSAVKSDPRSTASVSSRLCLSIKERNSCSELISQAVIRTREPTGTRVGVSPNRVSKTSEREWAGVR